jgi:glycosyltransferase involved in cell wall biosynthesis
MHVLYFGQFFTPEPVAKGAGFVRALQELGHSTQVVTGFPNYPTGTIYPGYSQRPWMRETIDDVDVLRVPLFPSHSQNPVARIANYASFGVTGAVAAAIVRRPDVAYFYHLPATMGLASLALGPLRGVPLVYDIQDIWPDSLIATGMFRSKTGLEVLHHWYKSMYRLASKIIVSSPGMRERLVTRGVPAAKVEVIWNWNPDERAIPPSLPFELEHLFAPDAFPVVFAGTMGLAQGLRSVLEAAKILRTRGALVRIILIGDGVEVASLKELATAWDLQNVHFVPRMPFSQIGAVLGRAGALLVHLNDDPLFKIMIPSKTQPYMAAGRPLIMAVDGDASELVTRAGAGLACRPGDPAELAETIVTMTNLSPGEREAMGRRGHHFYLEHMSFAVGVRRTEAILREAAGY